MATGQDLINAADLFLGEPYDQGPGRADPTSGYKDCSGLIAASYQVATGQQLGADISVTIFDLARNAGLAISRDQADGIAGACYLMPDNPDNGWGNAGHIGFSDGQGGTREATPPQVQALSNRYQNWGPNACLLPGINYSGVTAPAPPPIIEEIEDVMWLWTDTTRAFRVDSNGPIEWNSAVAGKAADQQKEASVGGLDELIIVALEQQYAKRAGRPDPFKVA